MTRAAPGAAATAKKLTEMGYTPLVAPLLSMRPLDATLILSPGDALAFTSLAGVMRTSELTVERGNQVFAVGDTTAQAAIDAGFRNVLSAAGDVSALATLILETQNVKRVVHPGAEETAGDLVGVLGANGVEAFTAPVYRTEAATALPEQVRAALESRSLTAVLIHSPKAGRIAADLLAEHARLAAPLTIVGLSLACVTPLKDLHCGRYASASAPRETELLVTLVETLAS